MAEEKTYLELSEGNSHKFYEVTIRGAELTIRYGRIGDNGQTSTSKHASPEKARAEGAKKIAEKVKKGYEHAVMGVRQFPKALREKGARYVVDEIRTASRGGFYRA